MKRGRQKRGPPILDAAVRQRRTNGDEAGQVLVLRAQAVGDPGTHARPNEVVAASVQFQQGAAVGGIGPMYGVEHAQFIDVPGDMRKQFADR